MHAALVHHFAARLVFDESAAGDAGDGDEILLGAGGGAAEGEAADRQRPLADGVDDAIRTFERREQQRAALQTAGVIENGDGDIDSAADAMERSNFGRHHHRRDVRRSEGVVRQLLHGDLGDDAQPFHHVHGDLLREAASAAGAVQTDDQAEAVQLIASRSFQIGYVLDARSGLRGRGQRRGCKPVRSSCGSWRTSIVFSFSRDPQGMRDTLPCGSRLNEFKTARSD